MLDAPRAELISFVRSPQQLVHTDHELHTMWKYDGNDRIHLEVTEGVFDEVQRQSTSAVAIGVGIRREQANEQPCEVHVDIALTKFTLRLVVEKQVRLDQV